jgi:hypothetical protein
MYDIEGQNGMQQTLVPSVCKRQNTVFYLSLVINQEYVKKLSLQFCFYIDLRMDNEGFLDVTLCQLANRFN